MAVSEELIDFVKDGLRSGVPRAQLEQALLRAGWTTEQVRGALASFAEMEFPVPVPRPRPYGTKQLYEYRVLGSDKYELCAQFKQASARPGSAPGDFWYHDAGRQCFQLDAQKVHR
jgi:hypothetical protein